MTSVNRLRIANTRLAVIHQDTVVRYRGVTFVVIEPGLVVVITCAIRYAAGTFRCIDMAKTYDRSAEHAIVLTVQSHHVCIGKLLSILMPPLQSCARIFRGVVELRLLIFNLIFVVRLTAGRHRHLIFLTGN